MSEEEKELIVPEEVGGGLSVPDHLTGLTGTTGTEQLEQFVVPPRLKIVQKQADDVLLDQFKVGDLVISPANSLVAKAGEPVAFVPLFFWAEWCIWNPFELKADPSVDTIAYRTTDAADPLVAKCRNKKTRAEDYLDAGGQPKVDSKGNNMQVRNVEHLNFMITLLSGPLAGATVVQSFFKAQHSDGTNFNQLIKVRSGGRIPLYAMQFEMMTYDRSYGGNTWKGLKVQNPISVEPWCTKESLEILREQYEGFVKLHGEGVIQPDFDTDEVQGEVVEAGEGKGKF